jgi:ABC-2 type transport system permease protein
MIAVFKREIKNYLKRPLFWAGIMLVIYGIFSATSPYLTTHYLTQGEEIVNDYPDTARLADVYEGYIPTSPEKHRELWHEKVKQMLIDEFETSSREAQEVIVKLEDMDLEEAYAYLENEYNWYGAQYTYEDCSYYKGTAEDINKYLEEKMRNKTFSFYYSRKFSDFAGLFMGFFATIMLSVLFLQDMRKHTYELLHTKPITAGKYVVGKVSAGFTVCLMVLAILNILFWILCLIYTKDSGFEVRLWDFVVSTALYILPNMLMIVSVYTLISLIFKNPLPGVPLLILYMVYSNMGGRNAEGIYGYWGRPFAIMVRFPGQLFDTTPPPMVLLNQSFLILMSVVIILISIKLWTRRRI